MHRELACVPVCIAILGRLEEEEKQGQMHHPTEVPLINRTVMKARQVGKYDSHRSGWTKSTQKYTVNYRVIPTRIHRPSLLLMVHMRF